MCGTHRKTHRENEKHDVVVDDLHREWAEGRLDANEYEAKLDAARSAGPVPRRSSPPRPRVGVALVVAGIAVLAVALLAVATPLTLHPAVFWVAPFVALKLAKHGHHLCRPREEAITRV
jgi:hypothetical protein